MTYEEASKFVGSYATSMTGIADVCDKEELSYLDDKVFALIEGIDFRHLGEVLAAIAAKESSTAEEPAEPAPVQIVRTSSPCGPCITEGRLIKQTAQFYVFERWRGGGRFEGQSRIRCDKAHVEPCRSCQDHAQTQYPNGYRTKAMRYKKRELYGAFEDTSRKRAAAVRSQQRQRDALPLLADQIAETQPSIDAVMIERAGQWEAMEQQRRAQRASDWRRARRSLENFAAEERAAILTYWNGDRWLPGDPTYLLDTIHSYQRGRLVRDGGTLRPKQITMPVRGQCPPTAEMEDMNAKEKSGLFNGLCIKKLALIPL